MKAVGRDLAWLDARIAEVQARSRIYRGEHPRRLAQRDPPIDTVANQERLRLRLQKGPPQIPPHPAPAPPSPPTPPSFPRLDPVAVAAFVTASARRARGDDEPSPPEPERGEDGDRDKPKKEPPEPGSLILDAIRRRQGK
jgi:hypothetical protein